MRTIERSLIALSGALSFSVVAYAALRAVERLVFPEPNPAMVIWTDRSAFVWRVALALYAGGLAWFGIYAWTARQAVPPVRLLGALTWAAVSALTVQAALAP
jgi:hypothetical protein